MSERDVIDATRTASCISVIDMDAHHDIVLAGGSGFLGQALIRNSGLSASQFVVLTRGTSCTVNGVRYVQWNARDEGDWVRCLDGAGAVVNLVGRTVDCVKTQANKRVIIQSRVDSVNALAQAWKSAKRPPPVWVQSSTAHIYGDTWDQVYDESSPIGTGFAPEVGMLWEKAFADAKIGDTRRVVLRTSFVIGKGGGAFAKIVPLTRLFLGGATGSGRQYMSWIHERDFSRIVHRAIFDESMNGIYVATAPEPVVNAEFMRMLRKQLQRPWSPRVPGPLLRIGAYLMRTDPELAMYGRRCIPSRLAELGFQFDFPELSIALADLFPRRHEK